MRSPLARAALALVLFTSWMALLFAGVALTGTVHLLLAGSLVLFPWRSLAAAERGDERSEGDRGAETESLGSS